VSDHVISAQRAACVTATSRRLWTERIPDPRSSPCVSHSVWSWDDCHRRCSLL